MGRIIFVTAIVLTAALVALIAACGVDSNSSTSNLTPPVDLSGPWRIALVPSFGTCSNQSKGFVQNTPFDIPIVLQNGNSISASFILGAEQVTLDGIVLGNSVTLLLEDFSVFQETLTGNVEGTSIFGSFQGLELPPPGCMELGMFIAAVKDLTAPVVTGEWDLTIAGTAINCDSVLDEGPFTRTTLQMTVTPTFQDVFISDYEEPALVLNHMTGAVVGKGLAGTIVDILTPPTRTAVFSATIDVFTQRITGTISGQMEFANGVCDISGGTFSAVYR